MKNGTMQDDSILEDTFLPITDFLQIDSLASIDKTKLISIIKTEHATNTRLASTVSGLSMLMAISIIINVILLIIIKRNKNLSNIEHVKEQTEKLQVTEKTDSMKKEDLEKTTYQSELISQPTTNYPATTPDTGKNSNNRIRLYTESKTNNMKIYGISIQGRGHIIDNIPCQDCHLVEILDDERNIGIAVVSDGAGSAKNSAEGSKIVCNSSIKYLKMAIEKLNWENPNNLPDEQLWNKVIREVIRLIQIDLNEKAKSMGCEIRSLAATFIILYFTPEKSYFAHVGDGRAGVKTDDGWKSILTPHKGEEANQTVFISNEILNPVDLKISGVFVPETSMINQPIQAFILMSDGCEDGLWMKNKKENLDNGDFKYVSLNQPFVPAIDKLMQFMQDKRFEGREEDVLFQFLDRYNENLKIELDDKTVCFGTL